jgi:hypothetical protein
MTPVQQMIHDRLTITDGPFKGARITATDAIIEKLMIDYAASLQEQLEKKIEELDTPIVDYKSRH